MPLGMEVGLSPAGFVLDGYPAPFPKRGQSPLPDFNGWVESFEIGPEVLGTSGYS